MGVERSPRDPRLIRDILHRGSAKAVPTELGECGVENRFALGTEVSRHKSHHDVFRNICQSVHSTPNPPERNPPMTASKPLEVVSKSWSTTPACRIPLRSSTATPKSGGRCSRRTFSLSSWVVRRPSRRCALAAPRDRSSTSPWSPHISSVAAQRSNSGVDGICDFPTGSRFQLRRRSSIACDSLRGSDYS